VVLVRTPYNRDSLAPWGARFAERGYHFVAQDTRGRFGSTGDFFPVLHEAEDGAATIQWLEQQPWCNG
jgi:putative CocE/NonD family hydrolase